ncbi:proton-translocating NADH-quinone oxidoreductase, chain L, partial [mine drainage metagenome]
LTAYYIFRVYFLAFSGERTRDASLPAAHEVPWVMLVPMMVLAGFAVVAGLFAFVPSFGSLFTGVPGLATNVPPAYGPTDLLLSAVSVTLAGAGILLAWVLWGNGRVYELRASSPAHSVRNLLLARYHVKAAYDWVGMVGMYTVARAADFFDRFVIDGAVKGFERSFRSMSDGMRRIQTGLVSDYAAYVVAGVIAVFVLLLFVAPYLASLFGGG